MKWHLCFKTSQNSSSIALSWVCVTCDVVERLGWSETISLASVNKGSAMTGVAGSQRWMFNSNGHLCKFGEKAMKSSLAILNVTLGLPVFMRGQCAHTGYCVQSKGATTHPEELKVCWRCLAMFVLSEQRNKKPQTFATCSGKVTDARVCRLLCTSSNTL